MTLLAGAVFALSPWAMPEIGLTLGLILGLTGIAAVAGARVGGLARKGSRYLIQIAVVLLGFRMDLQQVLSAGVIGLGLAVGVVLSALALGLVLGKLFSTPRELSILVSSGTAICGGSAIAAVAATIRAKAAHISLALGVVFILNAVSLYIFPQIGELLNLSPRQFGVWAGIAIHDVSSVVGAASSFRRGTEDGALALETATVVKLARVLWIVPVCMLGAWLIRRADRNAAEQGGGPWSAGGAGESQIPLRSAPIVPWYIGLFLVAAVLRTVVPQVADAADEILLIAKRGMTLALFLIGAGLSRQALLSVGWRPLVHSAVLWLVIAGAALAIVMTIVT